MSRSLALPLGFLLLSFGLAAAACGSSVVEDDSVDSTAPASGSGGSSSSCPGEGDPCLCETYLAGTFVCDGSMARCDCSECSAIEPTSLETAQDADVTCAGDPTGLWELVELDFSGVPFRIATTDGTTRECEAALSAVEAPRGLLDLRADGSARAWVTEFRLLSDFMESCAQVNCEDLEVDGECTSDCGQCNCGAWSYEFDLEEGSWLRFGQRLLIGETVDDPAGASNYCVDGDRLTLRRENEFTWFYRRVLTDSQCPPDTDLEDYGNSPCSIRPAEALSCAGDVPTCTDLTAAQCPTVPGCAVATENCVGEGNECEDFLGNECDGYGCFPGASESEPCSGTTTAECSDFPWGSLGCENFGCTWVECTGEATPCADRPLDECESSGCSLVNEAE